MYKLLKYLNIKINIDIKLIIISSILHFDNKQISTYYYQLKHKVIYMYGIFN